MSSRSALLGAVVALFFSCTSCQGCTPAPAPIDAAPPPPMPIDQASAIYVELVEAGCLAPDDSGDGVTSIYEQHQSDAQPLWLGCLYMGGSVQSCKVPCAGD
jgi:hypothetical protein